MLQTSCCPFSIGVCAGCWVERPVGGRGGAPANMLGLHRNLSTKQEAPSSCWDTCYLSRRSTTYCTRLSCDRDFKLQNRLHTQRKDRLQG